MINLPEKLPCDGISVSFNNFCLEDSPCRKCDVVCPFDVMLKELDKNISELKERIGIE